jgi:hypothetical protein
VGSISPQPGTSQMPQEMGADATRSRKADMWTTFVGAFQFELNRDTLTCFTQWWEDTCA